MLQYFIYELIVTSNWYKTAIIVRNIATYLTLLWFYKTCDENNEITIKDYLFNDSNHYINTILSY